MQVAAVLGGLQCPQLAQAQGLGIKQKDGAQGDEEAAGFVHKYLGGRVGCKGVLYRASYNPLHGKTF
jgi:hypothetical protein